MAYAGAIDAKEIRVAGTGRVYVSLQDPDIPVTAPTTLAALNEKWFDLGYTSDDGVTLGLDRTSKKVTAWQSRRPVRIYYVDQAESVKFDLLQWNEETLRLAFGGGAVTEPTPGVYRYDFPNPEATDERALVVDWFDGDYTYRFVAPKGQVSDKTETKLTRNDAAGLPVMFDVISTAPYIITNDPAFAKVS